MTMLELLILLPILRRNENRIMSSKYYSKIKVGIIGTGGMGRLHLNKYTENGAKVIAVADNDFESAQEAAKIVGCKAYKNYKEMIEAEELTAVSICTPPPLHKKIVIDCLNQKINVLCEKPMAVTATEAKAMVAAAKKNKVYLMLAYCHRFQWQILQLKEFLKKGKLGKPVYYRNRFGGYFKGVENRWYSNKKISGGGMILDTLTHSMDLFRYLIGDAKTVKANYATFYPGLKIEDTAILLLQSPEGVIATLEGTWAVPETVNLVQIDGTKGSAFANYNDNTVKYKFEGMDKWETLTEPKECKDRFFLEIQHFLKTIVTGKSSLATAEDGLKAMEIYDKAMKSAK